jgi:hypothetical protein
MDCGNTHLSDVTTVTKCVCAVVPGRLHILDSNASRRECIRLMELKTAQTILRSISYYCIRRS